MRPTLKDRLLLGILDQHRWVDYELAKEIMVWRILGIVMLLIIAVAFVSFMLSRGIPV